MNSFSLIVFDLDLTLWNCGHALWCDGTIPPYRHAGELVLDQHENRIQLYPEVRSILEHLITAGYHLALASRTSAPDQALELLHLFKIASYFPHQEIYPGDKQTHFRRLKLATGLEYEEMLFFDDEPRNIESVRKLEVQAVLTPHGINVDSHPLFSNCSR